MLKERLKVLFKSYDPAIRQIVYEVGELEQRYISRKKPRVRNEIDEIVTRIAKQELEKAPSNADEE